MQGESISWYWDNLQPNVLSLPSPVKDQLRDHSTRSNAPVQPQLKRLVWPVFTLVLLLPPLWPLSDFPKLPMSNVKDLKA